MKAIGLGAGSVLCVVILAVLSAAPAPATTVERGDREASESQKEIQAVFVLDTTGSMGGLIHAAKEKIWSIANTLASAKPTPRIEIGLVGYRDRGDAYVTQRVDLTTDLDTVYARLMEFQAGGGGDTPESVNQALYEAVTQSTWNPSDSVYKVIFLVGDCPPHMDYPDDVKYQTSCQKAAAQGIRVNTIQCGGHGATTPVWQEIARLGEGQFFRVAQSGGAALVTTPFDERMAALSRQLDAGRVFYGTVAEREAQEKRQRRGEALCEEASPSAMAQRATFNAGAAGTANFAGGQELLSDIEAGKVKLEALEAEALPEPLKPLSATARQQWVAEKLAERKALRKEIATLAGKRQDHIREQVKKSGKKALEDKLYEAVEVQAAEAGLTFEGGPAY